jgi:hypothetical protein
MLLHLVAMLAFLLVIAGPIPLAALFAVPPDIKESKKSPVLIIIAVIIYWCAFSTTIGIILGASGILSAESVYLAEAVLLGTGLILWFKPNNRTQDFSIAIKKVRVSLCSLAPLELTVLLVILVLALNLFWMLLTRPITNFDSMAYHMPAMAMWYQSGSLSMPWQHFITGYYPHNWELLSTLMLFPFNEDLVAAIPNLIAWGLFGLAIYALSRHFFIERIYALSACALALSYPIILDRLNSMEVDLIFAGLFLCSLLFTLDWARTRGSYHLPALITSLTMFIGTKMSAFPYAILIIIIFFLAARTKPTTEKATIEEAGARHHRLSLLHLCILPISIIIGGFWYLRNMLETSNPFGFINLSLAGFVIFPGPGSVAAIARSTILATFDPLSGHDWMIILNRVHGHLGMPFLTFIILIIYLPFVLSKLERRHFGFKITPLLLLLAILFFFYLVTPFTGDNGTYNYRITIFIGQAFRFALSFLGFFAVIAAISMSRMKLWPSVIAVLAVLSCGTNLTGSKFLLYVAVILLPLAALVRFLIKSAVERTESHAGRVFQYSLTVFLFFSLLFFGTFGARGTRNENRGEVYDGLIAAVERNTSKGDTVGYAFSDTSYNFYGIHLDRKVEYLDLKSTDCEEWAEEIRKRGITLLAVGPLPLKSMISNPVIRWLLSGSCGYRHVFGVNIIKGTLLFKIPATKRVSRGGRPGNFAMP